MQHTAGTGTGLSRRGFLQAAGAATVAAPVWLGRLGDTGLALGQTTAAQGAAPAAADYFAQAFGLDESDYARLLSEALARGGDYADLFFQHSLGNWIVMEDGVVNRAHTSVSLGVGVRVIRGERTGYAFSQVLEMPAMLAAARAAASLVAAGGIPAGGRGVEVAPPLLKPGLDLYPMALPWDQVETQARMDMLKRVEARLSAGDPRVKKTLLQFHDGWSRILVATSEGLRRADLRPRTSLYASAVAEQGGRKESNYRDVTARGGLELYTPEMLDALADETVSRTVNLFEARPLMAGEMPCVLASGSAGILLHEAIGHGLEADFNRRRVSTYAGRLGQRVAGEQVTVVDDGTIPHAHGAINFDDEGADSQRTVLVEKGVLRSYLHDRLSAAWYKTASTGSGRRQSYEHAPMPRMRATFMENGPHKPEEVIAQVKHGLYAEQFSNGQVNIGAGDFSFYVKSGWAIENGKLSHPVKDINVIGNGPQALSNITMVADDLKLARAGYMCGKLGQTVPVSQGLPTTLVSSMNVGGSHG